MLCYKNMVMLSALPLLNQLRFDFLQVGLAEQIQDAHEQDRD